MDDRPVMLLASDVESERETLASIFQDNFIIREASSGKEAISVAQEGNISIILLRFPMEDIGGPEILTTFKKDPMVQDVPVIALDIPDKPGCAERVVELGAADFLRPPYPPALARIRVRNVMANTENEWRKLEQRAKDQQIVEMNRYIERDSLTGILNRETFYRRVATLMQTNSTTEYCIIYLNINFFKVINDQYRVEMGDLVLKTSAAYFKSVVGDDGYAARIEADRFALCVPKDSIEMDSFIAGIDGILEGLSVPHNIRFYAGIYPVENAFLPVDQMCDRAHMALNQVKGNYLQRYAYYDKSMRDTMFEEQMITRDMEYALAHRQFHVYLQPIYNLHTNHIVSAEALVRWIHPEKGMISPGKFIPIFEQNGFITHLDRFIWEEVCRTLHDFRQEYGTVVPVSVNLSRVDFYQADLMDFLLGLVHRYGLQPRDLKLEVTESAYTENPRQIMEIVRQFRHHGFLVLMDDFGSGYSSLNMLKELPVDILKIDMAFVRNIEKGRRARIILASIVQMAKRLGMDIVVEGVETKEQIDYLDSVGCEDIQGYYFSKPLPRQEYVEKLAADVKAQKEEQEEKQKS